MPLPPAHPAFTTVPAAAAPMGVPQGAARSSPEWSFQTCLMGWKRIPKRDVFRPCNGIESKVPVPGLAAAGATDGMGAVGTTVGTVRTVVSSPGASSGIQEPSGAVRPWPASVAKSTFGSAGSEGRRGAAVLTENASAGCPTDAMGTAAKSLDGVPSETMRPMASTEDTDAMSDLTPCAFIGPPTSPWEPTFAATQP